MTSFRKRVLRTAALAAAVYFVLGAGFVMLFEDALIYFPTVGRTGTGLGEDVTLTTSDGVKIHGWYVSHPEARATLLWFHGNAGNIADRHDMLADLRDLPANVLVIDYRGYGESQGKPSEEGLYRDARAAYDWLCTRTEPSRIVIFGKSLGGAVACELASQVPCGGLILQSTFTSIPDMASKVLPLFPARWFVRTKYDNLSKIPRIACPKLFIHSRADEMIPFKMGETLFAAAAEPKESAWFDGAGHNELWVTHSREYYACVKRFVDKIALQRPR